MTNDPNQNKSSAMEQAAIQFANTTKTLSLKCPDNVLNPGLYFGFIAGAGYQQERIQQLEKENELLKSEYNEILEPIFQKKLELLERKLAKAVEQRNFLFKAHPEYKPWHIEDADKEIEAIK